MDIKYLETFLKVCDLDGYTTAAEALNMSQPGVSKQMQRLESELGVLLLRREDGHVRLTEAGTKVYETGQDIVLKWQQLTQTLGAAHGQLTGRLRIGSSTIPSKHLLPGFLARFYRLHPKVELSVSVTDSGLAIDQLRHNNLDIAIVGIEPTTQDLVSMPIASDHLVVIGHKNRQEQGSWKDGPFVMRESSSGTRAAAIKVLSELGIDVTKITCAAQANDSNMIIKLVQEDIGFSIISDLEYPSDEQSSSLHIFHKFRNERFFYVVFQRDHTKHPLQSAFLDMVKG